MKTQNHVNHERGFSLIEVTIAMAIAAVALVTLLGLIPQGMNTMREAGDQAIMGRIHQQLLNEIQLTPFDDSVGASLIDAYDGEEFYYDSQGEELSNTMDPASGGVGREKGSFTHIYTARISIPERGKKFPDSVGGASFGGVGFDGNTINDSIRPVIVEVAPVAGLGGDFKFDLEENFPLIETYQSMIVKMGRDYRP